MIQAKVGISYVSAANAKLNWQTENPGWNFNAVRRRAQRTWNRLLGRIQVSGGSYAQTQEFYSLLYKDFLQPNITSDVNGQFMGADMKVDSLASGQNNQYGMYSGWDIYHSLSELQAMLDPRPAGDMVQSLLNYYGEDKLLQQWGYDNLNNYVMVGDPADSILTDYYTFGAHNFNTKAALADMLAQATTVNDVRPGEALEQQYGYLPEDGAYGCCNPHGFMSTLLEYDSEDLALAQFAADIGDRSDASMLTRRANNWENLFDPDNDLLTSRLANGQFEPGVTPTFTGTFPTDGEPYVEGDPYEYLWDVPNDYSALFSLLGGTAKVRPSSSSTCRSRTVSGCSCRSLTSSTRASSSRPTTPGIRPALRAPSTTSVTTRTCPARTAWPTTTTSARRAPQFIWEMLGMYPENSGRGTLVFASPGFPRETIHLGSGHAITITAPGASPSTYYVKSLRLDGRPYSKLSVDYCTLASGASLDWTLGTAPTSWGSAPQDAPPSYTDGLRPVVGYLSDQSVTIAPGSSATVQVGAQNATANGQNVHVDISAPAGSGLSASPSNGTISVSPNGRSTLPVTVSASSSAPLGFNWVTATLTMPGGTTQTVKLQVLVAQPGSLLAAFNNAGISDDSNVDQANFDGGGTSYSAQALAAQGWTPGATKMVNGVNFTWPQSTLGLAGQRDRAGTDDHPERAVANPDPRVPGLGDERPQRRSGDRALLRRQHRAVLARIERLDAERRQLEAVLRQPDGDRAELPQLLVLLANAPEGRDVCVLCRGPGGCRQDAHERHVAGRSDDGRAAPVLHRHLHDGTHASGGELGVAINRVRRPAGHGRRLRVRRHPGFRVRRVQRQWLELGRARSDRAQDRQLERHSGHIHCAVVGLPGLTGVGYRGHGQRVDVGQPGVRDHADREPE